MTTQRAPRIAVFAAVLGAVLLSGCSAPAPTSASAAWIRATGAVIHDGYTVQGQKATLIHANHSLPDAYVMAQSAIALGEGTVAGMSEPSQKRMRMQLQLALTAPGVDFRSRLYAVDEVYAALDQVPSLRTPTALPARTSQVIDQASTQDLDEFDHFVLVRVEARLPERTKIESVYARSTCTEVDYLKFAVQWLLSPSGCSTEEVRAKTARELTSLATDIGSSDKPKLGHAEHLFFAYEVASRLVDREQQATIAELNLAMVKRLGSPKVEHVVAVSARIQQLYVRIHGRAFALPVPLTVALKSVLTDGNPPEVIELDVESAALLVRAGRLAGVSVKMPELPVTLNDNQRLAAALASEDRSAAPLVKALGELASDERASNLGLQALLLVGSSACAMAPASSRRASSVKEFARLNAASTARLGQQCGGSEEAALQAAATEAGAEVGTAPSLLQVWADLATICVAKPDALPGREDRWSYVAKFASRDGGALDESGHVDATLTYAAMAALTMTSATCRANGSAGA